MADQRISDLTAGTPPYAAGTLIELAVPTGGSPAYASRRAQIGDLFPLTSDPELLAIAGLVSAADRLPYFTGAGTAALATFTAAGRALVDDADAAAQRATLGLAAVASSGVSTDLLDSAALARLVSPAFSGTPTAPTAAPATNNTQLATTAYADAAATAIIAAADAMVFKGVIDCSANPNYPAADRGHTYRVSVAGKIGGASGPNVEVGDLLICLTDSTASGTHAAVGANWTITQTNLDGAVIGPVSAVDSRIAAFDGTTGKLLKDGGILISALLVSGGALGTPSSGVLTNATGLPVGTGISGLGAGVATFLGTPSSANLLAALTTKTGTGLNVFDTSPTLASPTFSGTTTLSGFTAGSVLFAGAGGVLSQDNTGLFWDDTNNRVGIGTATPAEILTINSTRNYGDPGITYDEASVRIRGNADEYPNFSVMSFGGTTYYEAPQLLLLKARGSKTSPTSAGSGDYSGQISSRGYNSTLAAYCSVAEILFEQSGAATASGNPGEMHFFTNDGTVADPVGEGGAFSRMMINSAGKVGVGNTIPAVALDVGKTASAMRVRNLFTDASNGEWFEASWASNVLSLGTNKNGTGVTRNLKFVVGGTNRLDYGITNAASWTSIDTLIAPSVYISKSGVNYAALYQDGTDTYLFPFGIPSGSNLVLGGGSTVGLTVTGNINLSAGDVIISAAGKGLQLKSGTGARAGDAALVGGTVTVTNTTVTANTKVLLNRKTAGGTIGDLTYTLSAGASFTINSASGTDTSTVTYMLVELN